MSAGPKPESPRGLTVVALLALAAAAPSVASADDLRDLDRSVHDAMDGAARAAFHVIEEDDGAVLTALDEAVTLAGQARDQSADPEVAVELGRKTKAVGKKTAKFVARLEAAREKAADPESTDKQVVKAIRKAAAAGAGIQRLTRKFSARDTALHVGKKGSFAWKSRGKRVTLTVFPGTLPEGGPCGDPVVVLRQAVAGSPLVGVQPGIEDLGDGRFRVTLGPDLGGAALDVTACGVTRTTYVFNWGAKRALDVEAPRGLGYAPLVSGVRAARQIPPGAPTAQGGESDAYSVNPPLPAGLSLDPTTGVIAGAPAAPSVQATYTVTARNRRGAATAEVEIRVGAALPEEVLFLEDGFRMEAVQTGLDLPAKMALAPDGRLFFNELAGKIRVIDAEGNLLPEPFATVPVRTGGERGLLGLALAPDFATSGHLFVYATNPGAVPDDDRNQILRFTAVGDTGTDPTLVVGNIPASTLHNSGDLKFGPDGKLYVTVGDAEDPALSQTDGSLAGRVLRLEPDGTPAAGNPIPSDPEWCRGLRNSYDMAFHPGTGGLFVTENGPMANDELNFVQPGKNFEWGAVPDSLPGATVGVRIIDWTPVIAPTGLVFHSGTGFGAAYRDNLFVCGYVEADLRRLVLSGTRFTDLDDELPFARWSLANGVGNHPLDILEAPDGALLVATFDSIWKISPE